MLRIEAHPGELGLAADAVGCIDVEIFAEPAERGREPGARFLT